MDDIQADEQTDDILEVKKGKTADGMFNVDYAAYKGGLDTQLELFARNHLHMVSPAEHMKLMIDQPKDSPFLHYSRTSMDVLYRPDGSIILIKDGPLMKRIVKPLMEAHRRNEEYIFNDDMQNEFIADTLTDACFDGTGMIIRPGIQSIPIDNFQSELTDFLFTEDTLGIEAKECARYIKEMHNISHVYIVFDGISQIRGQKGSYLTVLRIRGPGGNFSIYGDTEKRLVNGAAFGISLKLMA